MATIKDVAKLAGVSISTVSRCINRSGYVGKLTREKIEAACKELDFRPMHSARTLKTKKSQLIAFVIPTLRNSFFVELAGFIEQECLKHHYKLVLCNSDGNPRVEESYIEMIEEHHFDGAIIATGSQLHKKMANLPLVLLDRIKEELPEKGTMITSDHKQGARQAVEHLIESGSTRIIHIRPSECALPVSQRQAGYEEAMKENGLDSTVHIFDTLEDLDKIDFHKYDGAFVWNDESAIALLFYLKKKGVSIPGEMKIVGFDNNLLSKTIYPGLTTIDQPYQRMASEAVRVLIQTIENGVSEPRVQVLPTRLIKRETTEVRVSN